MSIHYNGPFIYIHFDANELSKQHVYVQLADGYTYESIMVHYLNNIRNLYAYQVIHEGDKISFPPINCTSPSILCLFIPDLTKPADISLTIEKFGQIPNEHYFDEAFKPILVTGEDGKEYKVIPSDQFK